MRLKTKFQDEDFDLGEVVEGVIVECLGRHEEELRVIATAAKGGQHTFSYSSIKEFMDDWEDAPEEPGRILNIYTDETDMGRITVEYNTAEEAEQAVEKLEAWKRLKGKGFRFVEWQQHGITEDGVMDGAVYFEDAKNVNRPDLDLLFGGEE